MAVDVRLATTVKRKYEAVTLNILDNKALLGRGSR